jgi:hypothetical protein
LTIAKAVATASVVLFFNDAKMTPMGTFATRTLVVAWLLTISVLSNPISGWAQSALYGMDVVPETPSGADSRSSSEAFRPAVIAIPEESPSATGVDWGGLTRDSVLFLAVENAFRCATEQGTRDAFSNPFFQGYLNSVGNMHGWSDGDPFYVNFVGHPMQGAISGDIWTHNDRAYRDIEFGRNRRYWEGKLRGAHTPISIAFFSRLGQPAKPPSATFRLSTRHRGLSTMLSHR